MVNTRRMESVGSSEVIRTRHQTRGSEPIKEERVEESDLSTSNETDSDEEPIQKKTVPLPSRDNSLQKRYAEINTKYSSHRSLRSSHSKRISIEERRTLAVYSRKMHDDSDDFDDNDQDSDDKFYTRPRRSRKCRLNKRMERRSALSLRPISDKCYTDPHSPLHFLSDDEGAGVRRSTRKRVQFSNNTWLADDQMHKVGYPTLTYSEEDSRDGPESEYPADRRVTRHSNEAACRRDGKTSKYIYYDELPPLRRKRRVVRSVDRSVERNVDRGIDNKENTKEIYSNGRTNGRLRKIKPGSMEEPEEPEEQSTGSNKDEPPEDSKPEDEKEEEKKTVKTEDKKDEEMEEGDEVSQSEDDDGDLQTRLRTRNRNNRIQNRLQDRIQDKFSPRRTRATKRRADSSSESEEEGRKYSLRNRQPKPAPKAMQTSVRRREAPFRNRRRFTRRRKDSSNSDSSSTTSDGRRGKPPKSPHSKIERMKSGAGGNKIVPIGPETVDSNVRFSSIGGLDGHVQCLKEMILLPMMYPEVFNQFQIQPPRGVLFHGPPGTGKTLIARALANECSFGTKKVSFFLRKGADLLSKWIGESEKQLRLLFQQAAELKPSIIFFDEIDGLAPVRSSRQDQVHASIVSTLLALMDGLDNRGEVIIIGATNRIDAIDPALRRPGRFDRELFFPLPSRIEREEILNVHVAKWNNPPNKQMLTYLAETAVGYCGSDLRALCTEAVIQSFRRTYPQVYSSDHRLQLNPENVNVQKVDFMRAKSLLVPASHRQTQGLGRKMLPILEPLLKTPFEKIFSILSQSFPHGANIALSKVKLSGNVRPAQMLVTGDGPDHGQTSHLGPAILYKMEHIHAYLLDLAMLHQETGRSPEEACIQIFNEARRNIPSVIYLPSINIWWDLVSETTRAILIMQLLKLEPNIPILFLATSDTTYDNLPVEIQNIFSNYRKEIFQINPASAEVRKAFFRPLILETSLREPKSDRDRPKTPPPLPRAPTPPPAPLTEEQAQKLYDAEEHTLRELRIFLRDMCKKLASNKLFYMFTKPVDTEEVPDYTTIIKQPMDLETMMTKVDFHRYECAKDFLKDIELICQNALEYNPARTSADKQIRHRACSLRDYAYTLIKSEMDSDFEDKCQGIATTRRSRKACNQKFLPAYINTPENFELHQRLENERLAAENKKEPDEKGDKLNKSNENGTTPSRMSNSPPRKRKFSWQRGCLKKRKRPKVLSTSQDDTNHDDKASTGDESKENNPEIADTSSFKSPGETTNNGFETTGPLSINCDTLPAKLDASSPLQSPKRRLSGLLSPSELLDDPLDFDDVDQALNESREKKNKNKKPVECAMNELEKVLEQTVKVTAGYSLLSLLDLYNHLSRIIKRYSRTHCRTTLPKDLLKEILRFKKEENFQNFNEASFTSHNSLNSHA